MDRSLVFKGLPQAIKKYRYAILVLMVGLILMIFPFGNAGSGQTLPAEETKPMQNVSVSEELEEVLSLVEGAGKVKVFLTVAAGEKTIYQTDMDQTVSDGGIRTETVIITNSDRGQSGLIQQINPVTYMGAIIVCQGADMAQVRLNIVEAVSRVTGLGTNQISVLKMK